MKKTTRKIFLSKGISVLLILLPFLIRAQDLVNVTTQVIPPYSSSFVNFHTKVMVTLQNTTQQFYDVHLEGVLKGNNGVTVECRPDPIPVFGLTGNQVLQITPAQLMPFFQEANVAVTGITANELYHGSGLPPGNYQLCFRARNAITGTYLSMDQPLGCFSFTVPVAGSDDVTLTTQVIPPYSTYLDDYINQNKLFVILRNNTSVNQILRLRGTLEGNNGVLITIPETFIPAIPIELAPKQVLQLSGNALREYFSESVLKIEGISRNEITQGNGLPEGSYQLCLQALGYKSGVPRSQGSPLGCTRFDLRQFEPPFIIQPVCGNSVNVIQPQNVLFTWSVPAGARPDQVEYLVKIIELNPQGIDPNQAMLSANAPPLFEKVVKTNSYIYSLADPKLEAGRKYAFRVTARTNTTSRRGRRGDPLNFRNNGHSQVCTFTYGTAAASGGTIPNETYTLNFEKIPPPRTVNIDPDDAFTVPTPNTAMSPDPNDSEQCVATCTIPAPTNTSAKTIGPGDEVKVGKFTMTVTSGNASSGSGTIAMNFLNTPINVHWTNIQVNTDNEMFGAGSKVTAVMDMASLENNAVTNSPTANPSIGSISAVMETVQNASRRTSMFPANNTQPIGLPLAVDYGNFDLVILGLIFTPTQATMNAITGVELPNSTAADDYLMLSASGCIRPNGFGAAGQLSLAANKTIPLSTHVSMILTTNTSASFDCQGITELELDGNIRFDRDLILPVNASGAVVAGPTRVTASFNTTVTNYNDWTFNLGSLSHAFTIPQLVGFKFQASNLKIDHSSVSNPAGMTGAFPPGYPGANNSWMGIYIGTLSVTLPASLKNNGSVINFNVNDLLLDKNGFSGDVDPQFSIVTNGKLGGWNFNITSFELEIENSSLSGAGMQGDLELPISTDNLGFEVSFETSDNETDEVDFLFGLSLDQAVDVDMWFAELDIDATSTLTIEKIDGVYRPEAIISGDLTISWNTGTGPAANNPVSKINIPDLRLENLTIVGGTNPSISLGGVGLDDFDNEQAKLAGFPLVLNTVMLNGLDANNIKLQLGLELSLNAEGNGISGETLFSIVGKFTGGHYNYNHTELNEVSIDVDLGVAHVTGGIAIYDNDAVFGDGFRGTISANINAINVGFAATMQIGRTNGVNGFRYWYFDLRANLGPTGIPIPGTAAAIYGIGGGAYHNMTFTGLETMLYDDFVNNPPYNDTPGASQYGSFTPSLNHFGFNASVAFGLAGARSAFNGDVKFSMELSKGGAVNNVMIQGGGYVMQDITGDRDDAFIKGSVLVIIVPHDEAKPFPTPVFHMETDDPFSINIATIVTGSIPLAMHFDPEVWYIKLGEWENYDEPWNDEENRVELAVDLKVFSVDFYGYFMMGNDIPEIPPMPAVVRQAFGMPDTTTPRTDVLGSGNSGGIAFGAGYHVGTDERLKFLIFYADIFFTTGFDVTLKYYNGDQGCGDGFGIHNWYAKGQMYAYLEVDVGLEVNVWFTKGKLKLSLLQATAAAALQAQLPNPTWVKGQFAISGSVLNGLIKVNTSFKFELGEKCLPNSGNPFDDMPIISEVIPGNGDVKVNVFTDPEVAFNFPNEEFDIEEIQDDGSTKVRTFYYTFESFKLKYKDDNSVNKTKDITSWKKYRGDGYSAAFASSEVLPSDRFVSYEIKVRGWEKVSGPDKLLTTEVKEGTFKTDKFPDHIAKNVIIRSTPGLMQRYFLKDEYPQGEIILVKEHLKHFNPEFWYEEVWELGNYVNPFVTGTFQWKARFSELATGNVYERNLTMSGSGTQLKFNIPSQLKNNAIYKLDLMVIFNPAANAFAAAPPLATNTYEDYKNVVISGSNGGSTVYTGAGSLTMNQGNTVPATAQIVPSQVQLMEMEPGSNQQMVAMNVQMAQQVSPGISQNYMMKYQEPNDMYKVSVGMGMGEFANPTGPGGGGPKSVSIQRMNRKLLESTASSKTIEHNLFQFVFGFKDSKFNTKEEKLESMQVLNQSVNNIPVKDYWTAYPLGDVSTDIPVILMAIEENFNAYELFGKNWSFQTQSGFVEPEFKLNYSYTYESFLEDFIEDLYVMPDDEEWDEFDVYDEYGELVEWGIDKPTPDWEEYIPGVDDWDKHRHENKWYPFGKRDFPTAFEMMSEMLGDPMLTYYKGSTKHGYIDWKGENVVGPDGLLTIQEMQDAAALAPPPPGGMPFNGFEAIPGGSTPPTIGNQVYVAPTLPRRIAILDYTEWTTMRDYFLFKKHIHDMNLELMPSPSSPSHQEYYELYFIPIEWYLWHDMYYKNRVGPVNLWFKIQDVEYEYVAPELNDSGDF